MLANVSLIRFFFPFAFSFCSYSQIFAVEGAVLGVIGFLSLFLFRESNYPWLRSNDSGESQSLLSAVNDDSSSSSSSPSLTPKGL